MSETTTELSPRQREIVGLLAEGYTQRAVARRLGISPRTVSNHLTVAYSRTGAKCAAHVVWIILGQHSSG